MKRTPFTWIIMLITVGLVIPLLHQLVKGVSEVIRGYSPILFNFQRAPYSLIFLLAAVVLLCILLYKLFTASADTNWAHISFGATALAFVALSIQPLQTGVALDRVLHSIWPLVALLIICWVFLPIHLKKNQ